MNLWIVTWSVLVSVPCAPPPPDEYGRDNMGIPAIACMAKKHYEKSFSSQKEAEDFVKHAPRDFSLSDFKISKREE